MNNQPSAGQTKKPLLIIQIFIAKAFVIFKRLLK